MEAATPGGEINCWVCWKTFSAIVIFAMVSVCAEEGDFSWSIGASGVLGWYLLPDEVPGNIDESSGGSYVEASAPVSDGENSGFVRNRFRYSHPFDKSTYPNYGFASAITFNLN